MTAKKLTRRTTPWKLSPQEDRVLGALRAVRGAAHVDFLFRHAREMTVADIRKIPHRKMQQHVGVVISRLNKKRPNSKIVPGEHPRTYKLTRRR